MGLDIQPVDSPDTTAVSHPFDRPTEEILMDLIYRFNQYRTPLDKIRFGNPEKLDIYPGILTDENTFVPTKVVELYDDRFDGRNGFLYRRISLTELVEDMSVVFDVPPFPFRMSVLLPFLNQKFHVQLTKREIKDTLVRSPADFVLYANQYSLVWIDQVPFSPGGVVPIVGRLLEDGSPRLMEDGNMRLLEDQNIV
jgi:hypothetical protein